MATEKITAIVDSIAELSVLELKELKETPLQLLPLRVAPLLLTRRPSLMLC